MRTISILNFKGGTGKSSWTENLAFALTERGKSVLVIDCDRQGNASKTLLRGAVQGSTLTNVLKGEVLLNRAVYQARPGLHVVPSDGDLDTAAAYITGHRTAYYILRRAIKERNDDYVFFDHAGAYTPVMEAGLLASNEMLIPCELEAYAVQGLFHMFNKLRETLIDHEIINSGIIPYAIDMRYLMARQYLQELQTEFGELVLQPIRTDSMVPLAQSLQLTVFEYERQEKTKSRAAADIGALAEQLASQEVPV
jgi:chromosome partitioning protein